MSYLLSYDNIFRAVLHACEHIMLPTICKRKGSGSIVFFEDTMAVIVNLFLIPEHTECLAVSSLLKLYYRY